MRSLQNLRYVHQLNHIYIVTQNLAYITMQDVENNNNNDKSLESEEGMAERVAVLVRFFHLLSDS